MTGAVLGQPAATMILMQIQCPICEALCEVSEDVTAEGSRPRCARCGFLFDANAASYGSTPRKMPEARPRPPKSVPPPPSVVYLSSGSLDPAVLAQIPHDQPAAMVPALPEVTTDPPRVGPLTEAPSKATSSPVAHVPLGPPPPYRPIEPARRREVPRPEIPEIPETSPAAPINVRVASALGPPPPYRPIIQGAAVFQRGPAPDLEPWRVTSLTRIPTPAEDPPFGAASDGVGPYVSDWQLIREPEPMVSATPEIGPGLRLGAALDTETEDRPVTRYLVPPPPPLRPAPRVRRRLLAGGAIRPALWAAGVAVTAVAIGAVLDIRRDGVMRRFPATTGIYAALGLARGPATLDDAVTRCDPDHSPGSGTSREGDCENEKQTAPAK